MLELLVRSLFVRSKMPEADIAGAGGTASAVKPWWASLRKVWLLLALALGLEVSVGRAEEMAVPTQPSDPVAAKAYGVFDRACASCHQTGRLKALRLPAGNVGNILDLAALARNAGLVMAGNADASPLYTSMQSRSMPMEPATPADANGGEITATDLAVVRDWIEQLPTGDLCADRPHISGQAVATMVSKAVLATEAAKAATTRYVSLVPLANSCASADEIEGARQAVALLMNALSLGLEPVKLRALEPERLVLEVELTSIGWTAATWDRVAHRAPAAPFVSFEPAVTAASKTELPVLNGDWLASAATRAPFYYELMGLPESLSALLASLRIDMSDLKRGAGDRIGIRSSAVARGNRLLERRSFANGAAWLSSEFAPTAGRPDMFDMMVAAAQSAPTGGAIPDGSGARAQPQVQADATLMHFDLPNGFPAFFTANPTGARVNDLPLSMLRDDSHPAGKVAVAQSCFSCHGAVPLALPRGRADDLRIRIAAEPSLTKEARDRALALHSEATDLQRRIDEDRARYLRVATAAGIEPQRLVEGLELLPALIARYGRDVTAMELADIVDVEPKQLLEFGRSGSAALAEVLGRIAFGPLPRSEVDAILPELAARRGLRTAVVPTAPAIDGATGVDLDGRRARLVLKVQRLAFQTGDLLTVTARSNANCYLTVVTVDARGRGTVLFPNEFEPNNFIEAGREIHVPGEKAPYQFRLRDKGQETLIGVCAATSKSVDGIHHDFEKQRFTELGDYRAFLNRNWGNREPVEAKSKSKLPVTEAGNKPDVQARTAIRILIE